MSNVNLDPPMRHPVRRCETRKAFHIDQDMIELANFKSRKRTNFQGVEYFFGKKTPGCRKASGRKW